ncbi:MAG: ATP-dependent RNA helicase HrpA, partial [Planctomycetaceae bacterium]|nr:ATP-dependent RNA helicase HrpA [Planctomycetaceae bacterium]
KVFQLSQYRKIVLATNVAESSLTVPGIRFVIDTGTARISRYSARSRTQRLPIEPVSQASADQRAGRCGRIGPGVCIRLYSEDDYFRRDKYTTPEIKRSNLAAVILQMKALHLGRVEDFPFIDPPSRAAINDGYDTLYEIGATDKHDNLTDIGRTLSKLPVDPRIGRMILAAKDNGVLNEMLIIAAALEIQDPRERPQEHKGKADEAHKQFFDPQSDYVAYLNLWKFHQDLKKKLSWNQLRKACKQNFLSFNRMKEWTDIHSELVRIVCDGTCSVENNLNYDALHRSILTGNLSGIAVKENKFEYSVCNVSGRDLSRQGQRFVLWAGSGLLSHQLTDGGLPLPAHWIMSSERVETSRRFLRTAAVIKQEWIEPLAKHLITKHYSDAHWNGETGYVHAYEKISLLGLTLVPKRRCNYGPIDQKTSREIFIHRALVEMDLQTSCEFFEYNKLMVEEANKLQDKLRRSSVLKPLSARYDFYNARIPAEVYDKRSLEKWIKTTTSQQMVPLTFELSDLCDEVLPDNFSEKFPNKIETFDNSTVDVEYNFQPGEENDGLTIIVPKEGLRQLAPERLGWLVPGLLEQKIIAMLKTLPKDVRRQIVPIPDTAKEILKRLMFGEGKLEDQVAVEVSRLAGFPVKPQDLTDGLPREMTMNIRVLDEHGKPAKESRDINELRKDFGIKQTEFVIVKDDRWNRSDITKWDFGTLPEFIEVKRGATVIKAFPMLQYAPHTAGVAAKLSDAPDTAHRETQLGITRLFYLAHKRDIQTQVEYLPNSNKMKLYAQSLPEFDFKHDTGMLIAKRALQTEELPVPRGAAEWEQRNKTGFAQLGIAVQDVTKMIVPLLENYQAARAAIQTSEPKTMFSAAAEEAKQHLQTLTTPFFLLQTSWQWLKEYPRYFKAISVRFENSPIASDTLKTAELQKYRTQYEERLALHNAAGIHDPELELFRWMLEEYRVSLFAQKLGTAVKVSPQRLDKQWEKVRR